MRPAKAVKLGGEEFLKGVSGEELRSTQMREKDLTGRFIQKAGPPSSSFSDL